MEALSLLPPVFCNRYITCRGESQSKENLKERDRNFPSCTEQPKVFRYPQNNRVQQSEKQMKNTVEKRWKAIGCTWGTAGRDFKASQRLCWRGSLQGCKLTYSLLPVLQISSTLWTLGWQAVLSSLRPTLNVVVMHRPWGCMHLDTLNSKDRRPQIEATGPLPASEVTDTSPKPKLFWKLDERTGRETWFPLLAHCCPSNIGQIS